MDVNDLKKNAGKANESAKSAIKYLVDCLYVYQQGDNSALGYMGYVLSKKLCYEDNISPSGFTVNKRDQSHVKSLHENRKRNTMFSTMGGTWQKDYKDVDPDNYELNFSREVEEQGGLKLFIKAGGRDNPYPMHLRKNKKGQWKITNGLATMCMDVRKPEARVGDF